MIQTTTQPAEWEPHDACWLAWPSHRNLWKEDLEAAQAEFTDLCRAISGIDAPGATAPIERLEILTIDDTSQKAAESALRGLPVRFHRIPFGDIWLRDTAPIFVRDGKNQIATVGFAFNGWGGKYVLPYDTEVSHAIAKASGLPSSRSPLILEGGSIDVDGEGTCLTSRQCLLNPNRNPKLTPTEIEGEIARSLGITKFLWLGDGLLNDHTDGHIDTMARLVAPGVAMCMEAQDADDPNRQVMEIMARDLSGFTDARGRRLKVIRVPSPGRIEDEDGRVLPASYMNFYISNRTVVVPTYGSPHDDDAVREIAKAFPGRQTIGLSAIAILTGGGAFHCITQQQPSAQEG